MINRLILAITAAIILLSIVPVIAADQPARKADIWIMPSPWPDGRCLRELFQKPNQWKNTRSKIDVLGYWASLLNEQFKDDELKSMFAKVDEWNLRMAMEVQVLKEYQQTGDLAFDISRKQWDRFYSLGAKFNTIALDEPFFCVRHVIKKENSYAVKETADYIEKVRKQYPDMVIGDIEPYPALSTQELIYWVEALNAELSKRGVRGLDFIRLDVDWALFDKSDTVSWKGVRDFEDYCRKNGLKYSLIYWASAYPYLQQQKKADERTWYVSLMHQGYDYILQGGQPDEYVIESWLDTPKKSLPEYSLDTFSGSALDFIRRIIGR